MNLTDLKTKSTQELIDIAKEMGLDNMALTYRYKGRPERPTLNEGEPFRRIVG